MGVLEALDLTSLEKISKEIQERAVTALESGKVVQFPNFPFPLSSEEKAFLSPDILSPKSKNVSYQLLNDRLGGTICEGSQGEDLKAMMKRFAIQSRDLVMQLFPCYSQHLKQGRTSFRPAEVFGRHSSYRKDDTRIHVDAFPSTPVKGTRILRVFTNVNPEGKPRVWKVGEPFAKVAEKMIPRIRPPFPGSAFFLKALKITKDHRTLYDHYMLKIHDAMKYDMEYQKNVDQEEVQFLPGSTWFVFTDQVSHAALSGQHLFEQTFYLPPEKLDDPETSPLRVLERLLDKKLT